MHQAAPSALSGHAMHAHLAACASPPSQPPPASTHTLTQVVFHKSSGQPAWTVFDKCAVRISVESGQGNREALVLQLVPREELPAAELVH